MRRAALQASGRALASVGLLLATFGCLREGPTLGGKFCTADSGAGECGSGFSCVNRSPTGAPLQLASPGGICAVSPPDCDVAELDCPDDAGFWICAPRADPSAGCFAEGAQALGGSVCMVGVAACRQYGIFQWDLDGGSCLLAPGFDAGAHQQPECLDAGGPAPLCLCDGIDQDCSGTADDFTAAIAGEPLPASPSLAQGSGCATDGGQALVLEPSGQDGGLSFAGTPVDSCAAFSLGHAYSVAEVDVLEQPVTSGTCNQPASGASPALRLFGDLDDGGIQDFGLARLQGGSVAFPVGGERIRRFVFCLPAGAAAPFGITRVQVRRQLAAGHCDLP